MKNRYIVKEVERDINEVMDPGKTVYYVYDRQTQRNSLSYYLKEARADISCAAQNMGNVLTT